MNEDDWLTFKQRLLETIAWCNIHAALDDLENCLRNIELLPEEFKGNLEEFWVNQQNMDTVAIKREASLQKSGRYPQENELSLEDGRLLIYFPGTDTYDGVGYIESNSYLGFPETVPPFGSWVNLINDKNWQRFSPYLVIWIPQIFVELTDAAVQFEASECICWIDHPELDDLELKQKLRDLGLLN